MNRSAFVIRPAGMHLRHIIRSMVEKGGLVIARSVRMTLPPDAVPVLYDDRDEIVWELLRKHMCEGSCEIGIVEGENAVTTLRSVVGWNSNPALCKPGTIRHCFGSQTGIPLSNGLTYFPNCIHAPRDTREAARDLDLLHSLMAPVG